MHTYTPTLVEDGVAGGTVLKIGNVIGKML